MSVLRVYNRTGRATTNFRLRLSAPATDNGGDTSQPTITATYPSACLYTFGTPAFDASADLDTGLVPTSFPEAECESVLDTSDEQNNPIGDTSDPGAITGDIYPPYVNDFPLNASPSIVFSEPVDPASLDGNIMLFANGSQVEAALRAEGSSVVIDPVNRLEQDTEYTITVGNGVTDLAGNGVETGSFTDIAFTTRRIVAPDGPVTPGDPEIVRQNAPFLTVLSPGMPCALQQGGESNFRSGGDTAGRCVGDTPGTTEFESFDGRTFTASSPKLVYPVFEHPANVAVTAQFSKQVQAESIQLADGCLIGGSGGAVANNNPEATVAVQTMDGSGQCTGVVDGDLVMRHPGADLTRGFSFRPAAGFDPGQRYWIVICGSDNPDADYPIPASQCPTGRTVTGASGLALNTDPLVGTGTRVMITGNANGNSTPAPGFTPDKMCPPPQSGTTETYCYSKDHGNGGPDIVMPFAAAAPTQDFYQTQLAAPITDTNGNGFFDRPPDSDTIYAPEGYALSGQISDQVNGPDGTYNDSLGSETAQLSNSAITAITTDTEPLPPGQGLIVTGFLSGGLPVAIRQQQDGTDCSAVTQVTRANGTYDDTSDDVPVVGTGAPEKCVPIDLLPGGQMSLTTLTIIGGVQTGQTLLRFPYARDAEGDSTGEPQTGYIVERCTGTLKTVANPEGQAYDYQPCFVANLTLTAKGPDGFFDFDRQAPAGLLGRIQVPQQDINVAVFGPVSFEHNGRLAISTQNANRFFLTTALEQFGNQFPILPTIFPGTQSLQLVGPPIHGGPVQSFEVP